MNFLQAEILKKRKELEESNLLVSNDKFLIKFSNLIFNFKTTTTIPEIMNFYSKINASTLKSQN